MRYTFCFHCERFVEVLEHDELQCGHTVADQQTMYEFLIDKIDNSLKVAYAEHNIVVSDKERRTKAFRLTIDFLGEWYSNHFPLYQ